MIRYSYWVCFESLIFNGSFPNHNIDFFSNLSPGKLSISAEKTSNLSPGKLYQLNFDGEGDISTTKHFFHLFKFCESDLIEDGDMACVIFFLTLEGRVNWWFHTLPSASIHSFAQFLKKIIQDFDRHDYRDVLKRINQLRMYPNESIEDF